MDVWFAFGEVVEVPPLEPAVCSQHNRQQSLFPNFVVFGLRLSQPEMQAFYSDDFVLPLPPMSTTPIISRWCILGQRPQTPRVQEASVYCVLDNVQQSDRLLRAYSSLANSVEFRQSRQCLDERVDIIEIPAADSYAMSRTSSYLVLKELRAPLQWGRSYPMTMQFERAGFVNVMVSIGAH